MSFPRVSKYLLLTLTVVSCASTAFADTESEATIALIQAVDRLAVSGPLDSNQTTPGSRLIENTYLAGPLCYQSSSDGNRPVALRSCTATSARATREGSGVDRAFRLNSPGIRLVEWIQAYAHHRETAQRLAAKYNADPGNTSESERRELRHALRSILTIRGAMTDVRQRLGCVRQRGIRPPRGSIRRPAREVCTALSRYLSAQRSGSGFDYEALSAALSVLGARTTTGQVSQGFDYRSDTQIRESRYETPRGSVPAQLSDDDARIAREFSSHQELMRELTVPYRFDAAR